MVIDEKEEEFCVNKNCLMSDKVRKYGIFFWKVFCLFENY